MGKCKIKAIQTDLGTADLVTFTEEILNGKLHFLYSDSSIFRNYSGIFRHIQNHV